MNKPQPTTATERTLSYSEKLQDDRWKRLSQSVKWAAGNKCEEPSCDSHPAVTLDTHHSIYIKGREPWDYEPELLICLCNKCHKRRQNIEINIRVSMAKLLRYIPCQRLEIVADSLIRQAITQQVEGEKA